MAQESGRPRSGPRRDCSLGSHQRCHAGRQATPGLGEADPRQPRQEGRHAISVEDTSDTVQDLRPDPIQRRRHRTRRLRQRRRHQGGHQRHHRLPRQRTGSQRQTGHLARPSWTSSSPRPRPTRIGGRRPKRTPRQSCRSGTRPPPPPPRSRPSRPRWTTISPAAAWRPSIRALWPPLNRQEQNTSRSPPRT